MHSDMARSPRHTGQGQCRAACIVWPHLCLDVWLCTAESAYVQRKRTGRIHMKTFGKRNGIWRRKGGCWFTLIFLSLNSHTHTHTHTHTHMDKENYRNRESQNWGSQWRCVVKSIRSGVKSTEVWILAPLLMAECPYTSDLLLCLNLLKRKTGTRVKYCKD
jgi:hypothetical protein